MGRKMRNVEINTTVSCATADIRSIKDCIHVIRGVQVILDCDLAALYGYATKDFNRQVKNNIEKFDADFMFTLTAAETSDLRCKISTSSWGGTRYLPLDLKVSGGIFHDRYIILDFATGQEKIYHCGASSKDGGNRVMTIETVSDVSIYHSLIKSVLMNRDLVLK